MNELFKSPLFLEAQEYAKIVSEINTVYSKYEDLHLCVHYSYGIDGLSYRYIFENYGFDNYNFVIKERLT